MSYGTVEFNGATLTLTQQPYMDRVMRTDSQGRHDYECYTAHATDADGNEYVVEWRIRPEWMDGDRDDESTACDWSEYAVRKA